MRYCIVVSVAAVHLTTILTARYSCLLPGCEVSNRSGGWRTMNCEISPEQGFKVLGLLLAGSTGQQWQVEMGWPDIPWLARA
jgi:hypothetical protein